jgi:multicomponent Na+:H+ antiporter subunit D
MAPPVNVAGLLVLPVALPLLAMAVTVLVRHHREAQRIVTFGTIAAVFACGLALVRATREGGAVATDVGSWPQGLSIIYAADGTAALLLTTMTIVVSVSLAFAAGRGEDRHPMFLPMVNALLAGVFASLLTADLFHMFVAYEVMLIASYVLLTLRGGRRQVRAGVIYIAVNLFASTAFLVGTALLYGVVGTVNLADLNAAVPGDPRALVGAAVVVVAVAVKSSLVPLHGWLPRAYVEAGPAVTALFSGLLTKVGVYTLYRLYSVVFDGEPGWRPLLLAVAGITMVVGVLGAVGRGDMRGILAFHMVSQVGYLVLPLGLWTTAAVTAGLLYLLQYIAVKGSLFLAAGAVETLTGTGTLAKLGGMVRTRPMLAVGFMLSALALAGIPPTSGFVGKFLLVRAAFEADAVLLAATAVVVSFFTLLSMVKIFNGVFWGEPSELVRHERTQGALGLEVPAAMPRPTSLAVMPLVERRRATELIAPSVVVGVGTVLLGLGAQWLLTLIEPAAAALIDPAAYLEAVRGA